LIEFTACEIAVVTNDDLCDSPFCIIETFVNLTETSGTHFEKSLDPSNDVTPQYTHINYDVCGSYKFELFDQDANLQKTFFEVSDLHNFRLFKTDAKDVGTYKNLELRISLTDWTATPFKLKFHAQIFQVLEMELPPEEKQIYDIRAHLIDHKGLEVPVARF